VGRVGAASVVAADGNEAYYALFAATAPA